MEWNRFPSGLNPFTLHKTVFDGVEQVSIRPEPIYFVYQLGTFAFELSGVYGTGHWSLSDYYNPQGGGAS